MQATCESVENVTILQLAGENLDASNAKDFKQDMLTQINGQSRVIFEMSNVQFVDSSGLGALLSILRHLNANGGDLKLAGMQKSVRALFELVRMHRIFDLYETREEALLAFER
jgi:anti-sigma B factor antagonist